MRFGRPQNRKLAFLYFTKHMKKQKLTNNSYEREILPKGELLQFALDNGMIDLDTIQKQIEMNERKKYLEMHPFSIWEDKQGTWHTYLPDKEKGRIHKKRKTEKEIQNIVIDYWKCESDNPTIDDVFNEWNDRRLELQKISASTHQRNKQYYNRHYDKFGKYKIKNIAEEDIIDFLEEQIPRFNLTAKAFSNIKGITKGFLKRAKKRKLINWNIEEALYDLDVSEVDFHKQIKEDYEEVFDEEEMEKIINYLVNNLDTQNIGILLMFVTGIRVGELAALKHEVFEENFFKIRRTETNYKVDGKTVYEIKEFPKSEAGVRDVVIPQDYMWLYGKIKTLNPFGEYIFVNKLGKRMTTNCFRARLRRICEKLNIYKKSPHKIRKTYGTILLDNNVDQRFVLGQMGHSNVKVTENHYHRNRRSIDKKVEVVSNIPDFFKIDTLGYQKVSN